MNNLCPACHRILYDRRLLRCGYCSAVIPEELRFSPERIEAIDREMAELEVHRKQLAREIEEAERQRQSGRDYPDYSGLM
jgi:hypothetical protein